MFNASYLFILSTILFGFFLFIIIRQYSITGMVQLCISWLLGSISTSLIIWILTLFFSLSKKLLFAVIVFHIIFCFIVIIVFRDKPDQLNFNFEKHYKLFLVLIIISMFSIAYLNSVYYDFPFSFPAAASEIIDIEMSFITSFRYGMNAFPRFYDALNLMKHQKVLVNSSKKNNFILNESHEKERNNLLFNSNKLYLKNAQNTFYCFFRLLFFSDPLRNGKMFIGPTLPLIYLASLNELGLSYSESSLIVCFFNTISTVVGIFFLSHFFLSRIDLSVVLIFVFFSGNSIFHFLKPNGADQPIDNTFSKFDDFDLIHNFGKEIKAPIYSPILNFLSFSKCSSFAIPLAIFTLAFAHPITVKKPTTYILAGIFLLLNPSPAVSLSLIISLFFYSNSIKYILPFSLSLLPKLIIFNDSYNLDANFLNIVENQTVYYNEINPSNKAVSSLIKFKPLWREYQMQGMFYSPFWAYFDSFGILFFFLLISPFALYMIEMPILTQRYIASFSSFIILSLFRIGNDYFENSLAITSVFLPYLILVCINSFEKIESSISGNTDNSQINYAKANLDEKRMNSFLKLALNFFSNRKNGKSNQMKGILKSIKYIISIIFILGTFCSAYYVSDFTIDQLNPFNFCHKYLQSKNNNFVNKRDLYQYEIQDYDFERDFDNSSRLFRIRYDDFLLADYLKESSISPRDPIFCNLRFFNPISTLAGRPVFSGDFNELWKRGADISEESAIIKLINMSNDKFSIMKELGFKYLFELKENPFVVVNSSVINEFNVLYTDEKYILLIVREDA